MTSALKMCLDLGHEESVNPRHRGLCSRCGRQIPRDDMIRNLAWEREQTRQCAQFAPYVAQDDPTADRLSDYAETRAGSAPWINCSKRDWALEGLEETADLRMYTLAALQELEAEGRDDEDVDRLVYFLRRSLAASVEAYDALSQYRFHRAADK